MNARNTLIGSCVCPCLGGSGFDGGLGDDRNARDFYHRYRNGIGENINGITRRCISKAAGGGVIDRSRWSWRSDRWTD